MRAWRGQGGGTARPPRSTAWARTGGAPLFALGEPGWSPAGFGQIAHLEQADRHNAQQGGEVLERARAVQPGRLQPAPFLQRAVPLLDAPPVLVPLQRPARVVDALNRPAAERQPIDPLGVLAGRRVLFFCVDKPHTPRRERPGWPRPLALFSPFSSCMALATCFERDPDGGVSPPSAPARSRRLVFSFRSVFARTPPQLPRPRTSAPRQSTPNRSHFRAHRADMADVAPASRL
jgi:hypothetical protein